MVITLLGTHTHMYTRTNTRVRTRMDTPQRIYCWQLRVQYHVMNTLRTYIRLHGIRVPCEGSIPVIRDRSGLLPDHYSASD